MARARSTRWRDWLLGCFGVVLGFAVLEVALRFHGLPGNMSRFETRSPVQAARWISHPFLPYAGRPNGNFNFRNPLTHTLESIESNSYGFRSHEFPARKDPGDFVVACFGGSTTYGFAAATNRETWPEILEAKLRKRYPKRRIAVFNLGLDMATTAVSVVNLALVGVHLHPDLVIVYHGINDLSVIGPDSFRPDHAHVYRDLDPELVFTGLERNLPSWALASFVVAYVANATDVALRINDLARVARREVASSPDSFRGLEATLQNFKTMRSIADSVGAEALFSTFQFREGDTPRYSRFNRELRAYFDREKLWYVDQDELIPDHDPGMQVDPCHFTPKGNELLAENYFQAIVARGLVTEASSR